ncbi:MAG: hypothetical protein K1Y01_20205 [Vicinamibacteria bacterium]|nr:hypothetical protein [Vicinamibacteria bacterium]
MVVHLRRRGHRLEGLVNRFCWHIEKTQKYVTVVMPAIKQQDDPGVEQYLFQSLALMLHSYMEDFFKGVIRTAAPNRPMELREHMSTYYSEDIKGSGTLHILELARMAAKREVSFERKAERLKRVFRVLFDADPFCDAEAESDCLDLVVVRNTITHDGAWPDGRVHQSLSRKDIVVETTLVNGASFYTLQIPPQFFANVLAGLGRSVLDLDRQLREHPVYRI